MNRYSHHIPGRLRVRIGAVKRNAPIAHGLQKAIQAMRGISSVDVNLLTGSVLVRYDPSACNTRALMSIFERHGHRPDQAAKTSDISQNSIGEKVARTVMGFLIEAAVERAALAFISAVL